MGNAGTGIKEESMNYYVFTKADWMHIKAILFQFSTVGGYDKRDEPLVFQLARMVGRYEHLVGTLESAAKKVMPIRDPDLLDGYKECEHGIYPEDAPCPECNVNDSEGAERDRRYDARVDRENTDAIEEASRRG
jgi:hypothetical protein